MWDGVKSEGKANSTMAVVGFPAEAVAHGNGTLGVDGPLAARTYESCPGQPAVYTQFSCHYLGHVDRRTVVRGESGQFPAMVYKAFPFYIQAAAMYRGALRQLHVRGTSPEEAEVAHYRSFTCSSSKAL